MEGVVIAITRTMHTKNSQYQFLKEQALKVNSYKKAFSSQFDIIKADAMQTPISHENRHCKSFTSGCIYDAKGNKISLSERQGAYGGDHISSINANTLLRPRFFSPKLKGNTFYLGVWMGHYGHFITETLSRLWMYKDIKHYDNLVAFPFIFNHRKPIEDYQAYFLHLLDIPSKKIQTLRKPLRFDNITIPEQGWTINHSVNKNIKPLYKHIRDKHKSVVQPYDKIFLSRNDPAYQRIKNVSKIETLFKSQGFIIFFPEQLTIQDQLSIYNGCKVMAGFSGSALHNCLFTQEDTLIIELADQRTHNKFHPMQKAAIELSGNDSQLISYKGDQEGNFDLVFLADELETIIGNQS